MVHLIKAACVLAILSLSQPSLAADKLPVRALYQAALPPNPHPKMVQSVEIAVSSASRKAPRYWYEITLRKVSGDSMILRLLCDGQLFSANAEKTNVLRYILQGAGALYPVTLDEINPAVLRLAQDGVIFHEFRDSP